MNGSFAGRVREAARELALAGKCFRSSDLEGAVAVKSFQERKKLRKTIDNLLKRKEFERIGIGLYRFVWKDAGSWKQQVMWRFLRMNKSVTVNDLRVVVGVAESYAQEWLRHLVSRGIVRACENGKYQLVKDTLNSPFNEEKAERLRRIREEKKARLLGEIDIALIQIGQAQRIVSMVKNDLTAIGEALDA